VTLIAPSRLGQLRGDAANNYRLFLQLSMQEVLTAFDRKLVFADKVKNRSIKGGHSARFKITGRRIAGYHTPGTPITNVPTDGNNPNPSNAPSDRNETLINLDGLLIAPDTIYDLDDLMEDVEYRQDFMHQLGEALGWERDQRAARILYASAKKSAEPLAKGGRNNGRVGFTKTLSAGYASASKQARGDELAQAVGDVVVALRKKDVPVEDFVCVVAPEEFDFLTEGSKIINADFNSGVVSGAYSAGTIGRVKGLPVMWSNHVTQPAYTLQPFDRNPEYAQNLTKCRAIIFHKDAMGILNLRRPQLQMTAPGGDYNVVYQAQLFVARMAIGMAPLRAECAAVIEVP
jgi:hypothetical protein